MSFKTFGNAFFVKQFVILNWFKIFSLTKKNCLN